MPSKIWELKRIEEARKRIAKRSGSYKKVSELVKSLNGRSGCGRLDETIIETFGRGDKEMVEGSRSKYRNFLH